MEISSMPVKITSDLIQDQLNAWWSRISDKIIQVSCHEHRALSETEGALRLGDLFRECERWLGPEERKRLAAEAGLQEWAARDWAYSSERIPPGSPIRENRS